MAHHDLKTWPKEFRAAREGRKPFEYRRDDRSPPFAVDDTVTLHEYCPHQGGSFTGEKLDFSIGFVLRDAPHYNLAAGYCVFGLRDKRAWEFDTAALTPPRADKPADPVMQALAFAAEPWALTSVFRLLRDAGGMTIPRKAEAEMAVALHWLVSLALAHGEGWRDEANRRLAELASKLPARPTEAAE